MSPVLDAETRPALRDKRSRWCKGIILAGLAWAILLLSPFYGWFLPYMGLVTLDAFQTTVYAPDYSWWGFRSISVGDSAESVRERIGEPIDITSWPRRFRYEYDELDVIVTFESNWTIYEVSDPQGYLPHPMPKHTDVGEIEGILGEPTREVEEGNAEWWWYSATAHLGKENHWVKRLRIDTGTNSVTYKESYLYID